MSEPTSDVWTAMATARTIRRFSDKPVDDVTLARCLEAATWAPSGANAQGWRFIVLRSPEQRAVVAIAAAHALEVIEPVYGMARPGDDDHSRTARTNRATYEIHDRAADYTSVLFTQRAVPDGVRAPSRWLDLPRHAELSPGCPGPGSRGLYHQLGLLRWRTTPP